MSASVCYRWLMAIIVLLFCLVHFRNLKHPFRGEQWALCATVFSTQGVAATAERLSRFSCDASRGVGNLKRYIPLAFFVPGLTCMAFGAQFVWFHLMSWFWHLLCAAVAVMIVRKLGGGRGAGLFTFAMICFSFLAAETLDWTFFSYIQVQTLLVELCLLFWILWQETGHSIYPHAIGISLVLASLLYEGTLAIFGPFSIAIVLCPPRTVKRFLHCGLFVLYLPIAVAAYLFYYERFGGGAKFQISWELLSLFQVTGRWFLTYAMNSFGFVPLKPMVGAAPLYPHFLSAISWNFLNICVLAVLVVVSCFVIYGITRESKYRSVAVMVFSILFSQSILIAFMVTGSQGVSEISQSYFLGQARYYYLAAILVPMFISYYTDVAVRGFGSRLWKVLVVSLLMIPVLGSLKNMDEYFKALDDWYARDSEVFSAMLSQYQDPRLTVIQFHEKQNTYCRQP